MLETKHERDCAQARSRPGQLTGTGILIVSVLTENSAKSRSHIGCEITGWSMSIST